MLRLPLIISFLFCLSMLNAQDGYTYPPSGQPSIYKQLNITFSKSLTFNTYPSFFTSFIAAQFNKSISPSDNSLMTSFKNRSRDEPTNYLQQYGSSLNAPMFQTVHRKTRSNMLIQTFGDAIIESFVGKRNQ